MVSMADTDDVDAQISVWDTLFCTSHVFLLGVAIGSVLTYHYFCKSSSFFMQSSNGTTPGISLTTPDSAATNGSGSSSWRDSNVDEHLTINPEQHNRRRRSSLLYR